MPKGSFIVAKTGVHPMKVKLRLFLDWGIRFGKPYDCLLYTSHSRAEKAKANPVQTCSVPPETQGKESVRGI